MDRRQFILTAAAGVAALHMGGMFMSASAQAAEAISLPALPYADNALEPVISARTIGFHYGKHHAAYVANVNKMVAGTDLAQMTLEEMVKTTAGDKAKVGVFNNAAQVWNHTFYWKSMKPGGGGTPGGDLLAKINADLGGFDKFKEEFSQAALTQFGSGWAWLVLVDGKLKVMKTPNAETPLAMAAKALITIDVWEHAYYLDYQNRRADYIKDWLDKLVNWDFAAQNLKG
ncbi:MAG: superoxide dismutase [Desulfarculus sp.]|nr:superoxide dismutase [Desulfarculus sp.]